MKRIVILTGIIIATLVSCSPEDSPTYDQNQGKTHLTNDVPLDFSTVMRDSTSKDHDTINTIDPIKPRRD